ncbi:MAG: type II toxin-antitoxin system VapC family toxin [Verrucomicrobiota bacterium]
MRILLDSHTLIWWMGSPEKIRAAARAVISDPQNFVFASAASVWEIGLKVSKNKLTVPPDFHLLLKQNGIEPLSFTAAHAMESIALPAIHGDPFDRALVAQCKLESMTLATRDDVLAGYGIPVMRV